NYMIGIFIAKIQSLIRNPWTFLLMTAMSVLFAFIIGGNSFEKVSVPTYVNDDANVASVIDEIGSESVFMLSEEAERDNLIRKIETGKNELGLELWGDDFNIIVGVDSPNVNLLEQVVKDAFIKNAQWEAIENALGKEVKNEQVFQIESASFLANDEH